jgi:hypothetical protein
MHSRPAIRPMLRKQPINATARNGRTQILSDGTTVTVGRWDGAGWVYPLSRRPLEIEPTEAFL